MTTDRFKITDFFCPYCGECGMWADRESFDKDDLRQNYFCTGCERYTTMDGAMTGEFISEADLKAFQEFLCP